MLTHDDYKVGWICALPIERAAAVCMLDEFHDPLPQRAGDENNYALGKIANHNVVIACLPLGLMGVTAAARVAQQMHSTFASLRFALMVGIGGGCPSEENDIRLGDVVVSRPTDSSSGVIQYDYGKALDNGRFRFIGSLNRPPDVLLNALSSLQAQYTYSDSQIPSIVEESFLRYPRRKQTCSYPGVEADVLYRADYPHQSRIDSTCTHCRPEALVSRSRRTDNNAMVHYGIIASGNQVMRDGVTRDRLQKDLNVLCFEMEASGLMDMIPSLIIRGVSDYADSHKTALWQNYAATTAAAYAVELLRIIPPHEVQGTRQTSVGAAKKARKRSKAKHSTSPITPRSNVPPPVIITPKTPRVRSAVLPSTAAVSIDVVEASVPQRAVQSAVVSRATAWEIATPVRTFENPWRETITSVTPVFHDLGELLYGARNSDLPVLAPSANGPQRQRSAFRRLRPLVIPAKGTMASPHDSALDDFFGKQAETNKATAVKDKAKSKKKKGKQPVAASIKSQVQNHTPPATPGNSSEGSSGVTNPNAIDNAAGTTTTDLPNVKEDVTVSGAVAQSQLPLTPPPSSKDQPKGALVQQKSVEKRPKKQVSFKLASQSDTSFQIQVETPPATPRPSSPVTTTTGSTYTASERSTSPPPEIIHASRMTVSKWLEPLPSNGNDFIGLSIAEEQASFSSVSPQPSTLPSPQSRMPSISALTLRQTSFNPFHPPSPSPTSNLALPEAIVPSSEGLQVVSPLECSINAWAHGPMTSEITPTSTVDYQHFLRRSDPVPPLPSYDTLAPAPFDIPLPDPSFVEMPGSLGTVFAHRPSPLDAERLAMQERIRQLELRINPVVTFRDVEREKSFTVPWEEAKKFKSTLKVIERNYESYPHLLIRIRAKAFRLTDPNGIDIQIKDWEKTMSPGLELGIHVSLLDDGSPTLASKKSRWRMILP